MGNIIDLKMDLPQSALELAEQIKFMVVNKNTPGVANYRRIFGPQYAASLGMSIEELENGHKELKPEDFDALVLSLTEKLAVSPERFIKQLDKAGIKWCLIDDADNIKICEFIRYNPDRLKGSFTIDPHEGVEGVEEMEKTVKDDGLKAVYSSSFLSRIKPDDSKYYPYYTRASELGLPVFIYTTMNYSTELPMNITHPIHIDQIAMDFPNLKIVASSGGWPWVPEMVGVARRHRNVFIDTSSHRPKYLATPGSGFEMLLQFGNTLLQDSIVFGSGVGDLGLPIGQIVDEMKALPLKDSVKEKWLYTNACRLFNEG